MSLDFTHTKYEKLCKAILNFGYLILRFDTYLNLITKPEKFVILRHDVDLAPLKALQMAKMENELGIESTYFFRYKNTFSPRITQEISQLGHEIGYHYESLAYANGDYNKAIASFRETLKDLREIVPIKTISAHGSLLSKWDNRELWKKFDFKEFGIIGDTYLSIDYDEVLYLTDTGRGWNKDLANMRDKVRTIFNCTFHSTDGFIVAIDKGVLPSKMMVNIHPPRWSDGLLPWLKEFIWQNTKNIGKWMLMKCNQ